MSDEDFETREKRLTNRLMNVVNTETIIHSSTSNAFPRLSCFTILQEILDLSIEEKIFSWFPEEVNQYGFRQLLFTGGGTQLIDTESLVSDLEILKNRIFSIVTILSSIAPLLPVRDDSMDDVRFLVDSGVDIAGFMAMESNDFADISHGDDYQRYIDLQHKVEQWRKFAADLPHLLHWLEIQSMRHATLSWQLIQLPYFSKKARKRISKIDILSLRPVPGQGKCFMSQAHLDMIHKLSVS